MKAAVLLVLTLALATARKPRTSAEDLPTPSIAIEESFTRNASGLECDAVWRLPKDVIPKKYEITLRLFDNSTTFNGSVVIEIDCLQETDTITLHAKRLNVTNETISVEPKTGISAGMFVVKRSPDTQHEMLRLKLNSNLKAGTSYVLKIPHFVGVVRSDELGLFFLKYKDGKVTRRVISSLSEPTYARMVFPCFDEPALKAVFSAKVERPAAYKAFSNMPLKSTQPVLQDRALDTFEDSLPMPTYLFGVVVGDLSKYPQNESYRTHIVAAEKDFDKADYSYQMATDILEWLETYTKVAYPLKKLDLVSLPDFEVAGMENWGLILQDRPSLIAEEDRSAYNKQFDVRLIAHELVHQWFGNLVTLEWWSYIWLKEGFATFFEYYVTDKLFPEWQVEDQFVATELENALKIDGRPGVFVPALTSRVCKPEEILGKFDGISYSKGGSILRMFEDIVGDEDLFQAIIRLYLLNRRMNATQPKYLFAVFDKVNSKLDDGFLPANMTFEDLGENWTEQAGVPLVTVIRNYASGSVHVHQERFYDIRSVTDLQNVSGTNNRWRIPLTWTTASAPTSPRLKRVQDWLYENRTLWPLLPRDDWILFNTDARGYYRVNYDDQNWSLIARGLKRSRRDFRVSNRIQIIDDVLSLGFAHRVHLGTALDVMEFLENEYDYVVWMSMDAQFMHLAEKFGSSPVFPKLEKYIQKLTRRVYKQVRLDLKPEESLMDRILRQLVSKIACSYGLDLCLVDAVFSLSQFLAGPVYKEARPAKLPSEIEEAVLCGGVRAGGRELFEKVRALGLLSSDNSKTYLRALSCSQDEELLIWHLEDIISNNTQLKPNVTQEAISLVIKTPQTLNAGLTFLQDNVQAINEFFRNSTEAMEYFVRTAVQELQFNEQYEEMKSWILSLSDEDIGKKPNILGLLEKRRPIIEWNSESMRQVSDWLDPPTPAVTLPQPFATPSSRGSGPSSEGIMISIMFSILISLRIGF